MSSSPHPSISWCSGAHSMHQIGDGKIAASFQCYASETARHLKTSRRWRECMVERVVTIKSDQICLAARVKLTFIKVHRRIFLLHATKGFFEQKPSMNQCGRMSSQPSCEVPLNHSESYTRIVAERTLPLDALRPKASQLSLSKECCFSFAGATIYLGSVPRL